MFSSSTLSLSEAEVCCRLFVAYRGKGYSVRVAHVHC